MGFPHFHREFDFSNSQTKKTVDSASLNSQYLAFRLLAIKLIISTLQTPALQSKHNHPVAKPAGGAPGLRVCARQC